MKRPSLFFFIVLFLPSTLFCAGLYDYFEPVSCRIEYLTVSKYSLSECVNDLISGIRETREKTSRDSELLPLRISTLQMAQGNLKDNLKDTVSEIERLTTRISTLETRISTLEDEVKALKQKAIRKIK